MSFLNGKARVFGLVVSALLVLSCASSQTPGAEEPKVRADAEAFVDPLPSWNDTATKAQLLDFVRAVSDPDDPAFVEPEARIATFDNDGTLWVEQPVYAEMAFALHRVRDLAQVHPEWKTQEPFKAVIEDDKEALIAAGSHGLIEIVVASHTGMSATLFETIATEWVRDARHPKFERPYTELVYQPQLELLRHLEANGFKTFIVSGGSVEFDKSGKPVGIYKRIGRSPILAFGNSDGDLEMLQWTTLGSGGARLGLLLHHDDAEREYAYDRNSRIGTLDQALDQANPSGWVVVSMKNDWNTVFAQE
jgi:hypothetical protein